jgi:hypothetical protein
MRRWEVRVDDVRESDYWEIGQDEWDRALRPVAWGDTRQHTEHLHCPQLWRRGCRHCPARHAYVQFQDQSDKSNASIFVPVQPSLLDIIDRIHIEGSLDS